MEIIKRSAVDGLLVSSCFAGVLVLSFEVGKGVILFASAKVVQND